MELVLVNIIDGLVTGLLLFMLSAGLTLIFSMMGVLNFAHASFYMLGAYFAYQISLYLGFWMGLLIAPLIVGVMGAGVERYHYALAKSRGIVRRAQPALRHVRDPAQLLEHRLGAPVTPAPEADGTRG